MAVGLVKLKSGDEVLGKRRLKYYDVTLDNSYPTGGYAITAISQLGARAVEGAIHLGGNAASFPYSVRILTSANDQTVNLVVYSGASEVANATNLSTVTVRLKFVVRNGK